MPNHRNDSPTLTRRHLLGVSLGLGAAFMLPSTGCGADEAGDEAAPHAQVSQGSPLYLIATYVGTGDAATTHLVTTSRFDAQTKIDPTSGIAVQGGVVPVVHGSSVFIAEPDAPVISRYEPGADGQLVKTGALSFESVGLTEVASWYIYLISATQAYLYDATSTRIVVWNPTSLTLTGKTIDLGLLAAEGYTPSLALEQTGPQRRGSELLVPVSWTDADGAYRHATGVVSIDTARDAVVGSSVDERGGEAYISVAAPNGDAYFFPTVGSAAQHFFDDAVRPTRILRVPAGARVFDRSFALDLSALGSGLAAAGAVPDGAGGFFFLTADQALYDTRASNGGSYWRASHFDFATGKARQVTSLPTFDDSTYWVKVDGKVYLPRSRTTESGASTTLYAVNGPADPTPLFTFDAQWYGFARLR
ncbi:MAG: hypothetical protein ABW252_00605 [Polyangiales bacterium]